jgi:hypothetical protein
VDHKACFNSLQEAKYCVFKEPWMDSAFFGDIDVCIYLPESETIYSLLKSSILHHGKSSNGGAAKVFLILNKKLRL